jgi:type II secretory pathway predicted ATPase ExeA
MNRLQQHFGFNQHPFGRRLTKTALWRHRGFEEAFRRLLFAVELDGISEIVAEAGCGKSSLLGLLAEDLQQNRFVVHYLAHSTIGPLSLINVLARKVGLSPRRSCGETALALSEMLLADERQHVLILDEAHAVPDTTLGDLRLLTIADYDRQSPFLLLLAGQPILDDRLAEPCHYSLEQRIATVARLNPLSLQETREYVNHRLSAAGAPKQPIFDDGALDALFEASGGIPRSINNVATASLIAAAARGNRTVSAQDIHDARIDRGRH